MHAEPTENTDPTCLSPTRRGEDSLPLAAERGRKPAIASSLGHASVANFTPSTPFPIFLSRSRCEPANPPLVYDHRRSDRCRYLVFSFRDEEDRGFNATAYTYLEI